MAEVQDDDQWLYGDEKENEKRDKAGDDKDGSVTDTSALNTVSEPVDETAAPADEGESRDKEGEDTNKKDGDETSSDDDDEPTVTIGKLVKQPDIIRPPAPTHRAAPTVGLKEDDFNSVGKINGIPLTEFNLNELEETPWRKPGADLSDYFNYGFNEETWNLYCDRQRKMRVSESGVGMSVISKPMHVGTPTSGMNAAKYGALRGSGVYNRRDDQIRHENNDDSGRGNTIQVMTADRRIYSSKPLHNSPMESYGNTGHDAAYGDTYYHGMGPPPTNIYSAPPPHSYPPPPPPADPHNMMSIPPPGYAPPEQSLPAPQVVSIPGYEDVTIKREEDSRWSKSPESRARKDKRRRSRSGSYSRRTRRSSRSRERRSKSRERRRTRSRSRERVRRSHSRTRRSRSRSKSKSPTHKHKRKRSKRDREED